MKPGASQSFMVETPGRGTTDLTGRINDLIARGGFAAGLCTVFVHHTSASLMLCEKADPTVRSDLERFMKRLVPDGDPIFEHVDEGPDDMSAHVRSILSGSSLSIPIANAQCDLGTWQGIYLWEHRTAPHRRRITVTVVGW